MKTIFLSVLGVSLFAGCANKEKKTSSSVDSGIENTQPEPTTDDTAIADTGTMEPSIEDTSSEDTAVADSGTTEPSIEDTAQNIMMPDFSLPDVNPYSASYGTTITVREQLQSISGWYFIKAT